SGASRPMTAAPARDRLVTRLARTARSHAPEPNRDSLAASRTTMTGAAPVGAGARSHRSYADHSNAVTAALPEAATAAATAVAARPITAASATVFIVASGLGTNRRGWGGLGAGRDLLKQPLGVLVRRRLEEADRVGRVLRHAETGHIELRERDPGAHLPFVCGGLEVAQDPRIVGRNLAGSPTMVEILERCLSGLAERESLGGQHGHRFGATALPEQCPADRVVVPVLRQLRIFAPERGPIVSKRLLDGTPLGRCAPGLAERGLPQLDERHGRYEVALIARARPPRDRPREVGRDAQAPGVRGAREELGPRVTGARRGQEFRRRLGVAMSQLQDEGQVESRVRLLGAPDEDLSVRFDRPVQIAERVAHQPETVEGLDEIGLAAQDLLELGARGRPVLLRHERRGENLPGSYGIRVLAQEGAKLLDRPIEVAHLVEGEPQALAGLDQGGLKPERLAERSGGRRRVTARHRRPAALESLPRPGLALREGYRGRGSRRFAGGGRSRRALG